MITSVREYRVHRLVDRVRAPIKGNKTVLARGESKMALFYLTLFINCTVPLLGILRTFSVGDTYVNYNRTFSDTRSVESLFVEKLHIRSFCIIHDCNGVSGVPEKNTSVAISSVDPHNHGRLFPDIHNHNNHVSGVSNKFTGVSMYQLICTIMSEHFPINITTISIAFCQSAVHRKTLFTDAFSRV